MKFSLEDRKDVSGKLMDLGNITFGAMSIGQAFVSKSIVIGILGLLILLFLYALAIYVRKGSKIWTGK